MTKRKKEVRGWMIETRNEDGTLGGRYFSVRKGAMTIEEYATLFDTMQAAEAYAAEFGYTIGKDVEVIENGF